MRITFLLNGKKYYSNRALNLSDLIKYFNCNAKLFILEYNGLICNKNYWERILVSDLDKIEIVTIVGGG